MKLIKIKLKNFRCYQSEQEFRLEDLTAIIGKNDIGKSAILEAVDGFFNDSIDEGDLSSNAKERQIELTCYFDNVPDKVTLDTSVESSPEDEGILNADNQLEIKKVVTFSARKTIATYLIALHPSDSRLKDLLSMKNTQLKNMAEEHKVNLNEVNKRKNPPLREAIRNHIGGERAIIELKVDGSLDSENNLKAIWTSLKKLLPVFSLFKSDKPFDDKDGDIKDPLQSAIDEALSLPEIQDMLEKIEYKVKKYSTSIADETIKKLKNFDENISEKMKSEFSKDPAYRKIFDITLLNENNVPLNKRGSGIRRLVVLSFFQAQAEKRKLKEAAPSIIYAIEEPETSQHPNHQTMIIDALSDLSNHEDVQVIFTTHSANLVREIPPQSLRFISTDTNNNNNIQIYDGCFEDGEINEYVISKVIDTLGILPNPSDRIKVLLYVEGNNDVLALKRYSEIISKDDSSFVNLNGTEEVGYIITGGSSLKHYVEEQHLAGLGKHEVHIYDNDVEKYGTLVEQINKSNKKVAFNTSKLELENYLHHEAIIDAYKKNGTNIQIDAIDDESDVPMLVAEALSNNWNELSDKDKKTRASDKKKFLNTEAVENMSVARIKERGGYDDITKWLIEIKKHLT